jgi:uroporphyrinogen-III synthase
VSAFQAFDSTQRFFPGPYSPGKGCVGLPGLNRNLTRFDFTVFLPVKTLLSVAFQAIRLQVPDPLFWGESNSWISVDDRFNFWTARIMPGSPRPIVCSFESRRADEMSALIARHGGQPLSAPSMREIPIEDNPIAIRFVEEAIAAKFPIVILLTGVGTEALFEVARSQNLHAALLEAFRKSSLIIRGPKPAAVLSRLGLKYAVRAPEPNTWRELIEAIDQSEIRIAGQNVAVQEYGLPNARLYAELEARGAIVTPIPVYRWALPEDMAPLHRALQETAAGNVDILLFTSANQVSNVLEIAEQGGHLAAIRGAIEDRTLLASIGPTCSEFLSEKNWPVHFEASPPKMGPLVRGAIDVWQSRRTE